MNAQLGRPASAVLHWSENVKEHSQRRFVSRELAKLPVVITNTIVLKRPLMGTGTELSDAGSMYNYAIRRVLERITWYVRARGGNVIITFAHVRNFPYHRLWRYLGRLREQDTEIRWSLIQGRILIEQPNRSRYLQLADLAAGTLGSALRPDKFGEPEPAYFRELFHRIYIQGGGDVTSYGMNLIGPPAAMNAYDWWPRFVKACKRRAPTP
jgi:hypothetical protein